MMATTAVADLHTWLEEQRARDLQRIRANDAWLAGQTLPPPWVPAEYVDSHAYKAGLAAESLRTALMLIDEMELRAAQP